MLTQEQMLARIVRYGELKPCRTAFIDAHTPGSDQKENFTIIGGGVSESPDQHVHIAETPGFNIGAAGQPPRCRNSLHTHTTAEVFFILKGQWRFFWGRWGDAGEVVMNEGDLINIPTGVFRGFENIGTDYGMIMAVLGGDDAGGGVHWAPQVIQEAQQHGLILGENGCLYDTKKHQNLPDEIHPMPLMTDAQLAEILEPGVDTILRNYLIRYQDMMALSRFSPCDVISESGLSRDRPGFEMDFISRESLTHQTATDQKHQVLMVMKGHWKITWDLGNVVLNPGDVCALPPGFSYHIEPSMSGEASLFRVTSTDDPAGATRYLHDYLH